MPKTPDYFQDKTILITGGASGIGEALALRYHEECAKHVVVADLDGDGLDEIVAFNTRLPDAPLIVFENLGRFLSGDPLINLVDAKAFAVQAV